MADILVLDRFRKNPTALNAAMDGPSDSEDNGLVQIRRKTARAEVFDKISTINERIDGLEELGFPVAHYRAALAALQPKADAFNALCPPSSSPYSGQLSESMAVISKEQFQEKAELVEQLNALAQRLVHTKRVVDDIVRLRKGVVRLKNTALAKNLRMADWDDPDLGLCQVIDIAADPQGFLARAEASLVAATTAVNEERFTDAYGPINEVEQTCACLQVVGNAMVHGALVEC